MQLDILPAGAPKEARAILHDVFGLPSFRPGQEEVVEAQLAGRDVLSVAPTGSGKSISYWIPALAAEGVTLVVSPLIALMKDQVDRLRGLGVAAAFVNSSIPHPLQEAELRRAESGRLTLLYLAPERLSRPGFLARLGRLQVRRVVVDEAHCISTWGHDFRPDYRLLGAALEACRRPPVAAFTATATPRVRQDIAVSLAMRDPLVSVTGFNRPNLRLEVVRCRGDAGKLAELERRLDPGQGRALVYTGTVAASEEVATRLAAAGRPAAAYHGRLGEEERRTVQDRFSAGALKVVVATSAFGMGVDLPDIRQVFHYHLPGSIEAYYQEAGRAGRDGLPAEATVLFSPADRQLQAFFIEQTDSAPAQREAAYARLAQVMAYAQLDGCRHARIGDYFGEAGVARTCSACDNCLAAADGRRLTRTVSEPLVRAALEAVASLSGRVGAANMAQALRGRPSSFSKRYPWVATKPFFGALADSSEEDVRELLRALLDAGLVLQSHGEYPVLALSREGRQALAGELPGISISAPPPAPIQGAKRARGAVAPEPELVERLRRWRTQVSRAAGVPAYVVFHDRTLAEIAARQPATLPELGAVPGVGPAKLERYGSDLLALLADKPEQQPRG